MFHSEHSSPSAQLGQGVRAPAAARGRADALPAHHQPRRVIRGETFDPINPLNGRPPSLAHIDWFACTLKPPKDKTQTWLAEAVESIFGIPAQLWRPRRGGWQGYETCFDIANLGLVAFGGNAQRATAHISLNGHGCTGVRDWNAVRRWCDVHDARITRVDLAHDDFEGETVNFDQAVQWWESGKFNSGGRSPDAHSHNDHGSNKGKTFEVGRRANGKFCRIYEKGKQLGDPASPWCRVEVEFRGKSRVIPLDIVTRPGEYLSGAFPCLAYLCERQDKVRTTRVSLKITYDRMVKWLRMQCGPALHVMTDVEGGDAAAVLVQVLRPGMPKRLCDIPVCGGESLAGAMA